MKKDLLFLLLILLLFAFSCVSKPQADSSSVAINKIESPLFSADSAYSYIEKQCSFGPRVPGTKAHAECLNYFVEFFKSVDADTVIVQSGEGRIYNGTIKPIRNVIASFNVESEHRIMLCAHWDSRAYSDHDSDPKNHTKPLLGAGDGASGVGVLMELARLFNNNPTKMGVDLILFDLEDWGAPEWARSSESMPYDGWCLGSTYWAKRPHRVGYQAQYAILLDMVAAPDALFYREYFSNQYASWLVDKVWNSAADLGFSDRFINQNGGAVVDDHLPVNEILGVPCINIVHHNPYSENGFGDFWHTQNDDMTNISRETLNDVGTLLIDLLYQ